MIYVRQGAIITGLQNRFKEFRRDKKQRKETPIVDPNTPPKCQQPNSSKSPVQNLMKVPDIPEGEDKHSFERLNNMLKSEFKKQKPKKEVLVELMRATYPQRRANILATSTPVADLLIKYPFLGKEEQASSNYHLASVECGVHQHSPNTKGAVGLL